MKIYVYLHLRDPCSFSRQLYPSVPSRIPMSPDSLGRLTSLSTEDGNWRSLPSRSIPRAQLSNLRYASYCDISIVICLALSSHKSYTSIACMTHKKGRFVDFLPMNSRYISPLSFSIIINQFAYSVCSLFMCLLRPPFVKNR